MHKEKMNSVGVLVKGTVILSVAAFLTKVLSAVYRVPFQNIVGDIGFYIYQQIYPFYGIAVSFAIYGFPVIISKLYAEQTDPSDEEEKQTIFFSSLLAVGMICLIIFFLLYAGSETFASFMGDERLQPLIRAVSFSYLTVPRNRNHAADGNIASNGAIDPRCFDFVSVGIARFPSLFII